MNTPHLDAPHSSNAPSPLTVDTAAVAQQLSALVQIPSVTPTHDGPRARGAGEARLAGVLEARFRALGASEVHLDPVMPDRPNVIAIWRGVSDRWLGVDVHMDTVGVEQMVGDPFDGRIADGRVYGRGAVDTKPMLAICLTLLEALHRRGQGLHDNLLIAATCDEEGSAQGAPALAAWLTRRGLVLDELVVAEPTDCVPVHGHKGVLRMTFEIQGVAAHTSKPHLGKNAVLAAARLALAFEAEHDRLQAAASDSPLGAPTLTVSMFHGGQAPSVVPDRARLVIDRRVVTGESAAGLANHYEQMARQQCPLPMQVSTMHAIDAFHQPADAPMVQAFTQWTGAEAGIVPYCTNAWAYGKAAKQCLVLGPGSIDQAHGDVEWVAISELAKMTQVIRQWWERRAAP